MVCVRSLPIRILIFLVVGSIPHSAHAGFWQTFHQKCKKVIQRWNPRAPEPLTLPDEQYARVVTLPDVAISQKQMQWMWELELTRFPELIPLLSRANTEAQFQVLSFLVNLSLTSAQLKRMDQIFDQFTHLEQVIVFFKTYKGWFGLDPDIDPEYLAAIFRVKSKLQITFLEFSRLHAWKESVNIFIDSSDNIIEEESWLKK